MGVAHLILSQPTAVELVDHVTARQPMIDNRPNTAK
jgi:hypothetical protein